jgi:hypothetical protein
LHDEEDTHTAYKTSCNNNGSLEDEDYDVNLTNDDLAFGTNIGKDGFDTETGLPASDTIQEDFDTEAHAAGKYTANQPLPIIMINIS